MSRDWYPGICECCAYWGSAEMLQQTFAALESSFNSGNDACIDCAKAMIEVVCRVIIDELDDPASPKKPSEQSPSFSKWVSAAVRVLKLGDNRDDAFRKLVSQHHSLTACLGELRNGAGPVSHGKEGFLARLSLHHQRAAVLSADAIVAFLHHAFLDAEVRMGQTKRPYDEFSACHIEIDRWAEMDLSRDETGSYILTVKVGEDEFPITIDASAVLFHLDRTAYVEALRAGRNLAPELTSGFSPVPSHQTGPLATSASSANAEPAS